MSASREHARIGLASEPGQSIWKATMALFASSPRAAERTTSRRARVGWILLTVALVAGVILAVSPTSYVIEQPGPVFDTLGSAPDADGNEIALITISGETTYPTEGSLDLLTVSIYGNPDRGPSWLDIAGAWFDPARAVLPLEAVFPSGVTTEQRNEQNQTQMVNSQHDATAAALIEQGFDVPRTVQITQVFDGSPATGVLQANDVIVSVNGQAANSVTQLRAALADNGTEKAATISIVRGDVAQSVEVTPTRSGDAVVAGIGVVTEYDFPFDVTLQLDKVGGPSAGMMFALGIIDKLTPGPLTGGAHVAGTGTIDSDGNVGPIGGVVQKMHGALNAGASWFLAPAGNCASVVGHVPDGLEVFKVSTLQDSLAVLDVIASDGSLDALPRCTAG